MAHPTAGYHLADGTRIPGTTTIIGRFKESGGLIRWAYGQGMAAQRGEIKDLYDKRDEAADAGTAAHSMVEAHIKKIEYDPQGLSTDLLKQAEKAFSAYLSWESMTRLEIVEQETSLVSEKYRFGGTPDAIGLIDGKFCLLDWKTSNGIYQDYLIQLAAYQELWNENRPDMPLTGGFHLCRFSKEFPDFHHHYFEDLSEALRAFILMRELYDIDKILKKRAK